jgi:3-oxoacid CoA-transferase subunit B
MEHVAHKKDGTVDMKLLPQCTLPLTGVGVIDMVITDMGVFEITPNGLKLLELASGVSIADVQANTAAKLDVSAVALAN